MLKKFASKIVIPRIVLIAGGTAVGLIVAATALSNIKSVEVDVVHEDETTEAA